MLWRQPLLPLFLCVCQLMHVIVCQSFAMGMNNEWSNDWMIGSYKAKYKKLLCCPFGDNIFRSGRSVGNLFFFFLYSYTLSQSPKQNMHSKWWQPNCQSNFLAVKPKTEGFNTILTTKLNDYVLIMASFETNNSKNWSLNTKKKKKPDPTFARFWVGRKRATQHFFFRPNVEWQVFCDTENTEKLTWKLSAKWKTQKIVENSVF